MSMTFTKLFSSITESTVWCEPDRVRLVWITMLAMADSRGRVWASVPGLANRARVPVEDAEKAIDCFLSPDKYSRTSDNDGRRIEPIDGGWRLLNHEKYRAIRDEESIKESKRKYINARRQAEKEVLQSSTVSTVERGRHNAEAEAEAEADAINQGENVGERATDPEIAEVVGDSAPSPAGRVCKLLRQNGCPDTNPGHPDLLALIAAGATDDEFIGAAVSAQGKDKPFTYAIRMLIHQRETASRRALHVGALPEQETPGQRSARLRIEAAVPGLAAKRKAAPVTTLEVFDVSPRRLG